MQIESLITTIDTHTEGGPTRVISGGVPKLAGATMTEKMDYFKSRFDDLRRLLMLEPRGYPGMFGAVVTEATNPKADIGVIFLTSSGYLNMCVHSAIGVATACLETGMIAKREDHEVTLDTPAGLIELKPHYDGSTLTSMTITTNPAYVHFVQETLDAGLKSPVNIAVVFSEVFFAVVDAKALGVRVAQDNIAELTALGTVILKAANENLAVEHPKKPAINTIELALLYEETGKKSARNAVISRAGSLDRSPCGAGTGAKMAWLHGQGGLGLNEPYINESLFGTCFSGKCVEEVEVGTFRGVISKIRGAAYVTGLGQFIIDKRDRLVIGVGE